MKKFLLLLLPVVLAIIVFLAILFIISKQTATKGALQVTSLPQSNVYLNGALIGKTPLYKDTIATGTYTVRLVPSDPTRQSYEDTITIYPLVLTVVDRTFGDVGKESGSIISLNKILDNKTAQLFVSSIPSGSDVAVDGNIVGQTPTTLKGVTDSDHEVTISKPGYATKTVRIHTVLGFTLQIVATLPTDLSTAIPTPSASPSATLTPRVPSVVILDTPTGFLRVRDSASLGGNEVIQVKPGEIYPIISEQSGWYQIQLPNNKQGWVNASYVKKQ
jgi:hypothetical protein